jgi:hypothetical protein
LARRKHISDAVTNRLFALSGNECAFPGCSHRLTTQQDDERSVTVGERAHLAGHGRQGPRSEAAGQLADIDAIENLILLCHECHKRVDENPRREVLILTKMNWNSARFAERLPVTVRFAKEVGSILRDLADDYEPEARYAFYM